MAISPISPSSLRTVEPLRLSSSREIGFGDVLKDAIRKVGEFDDAASKGVESFLNGENDDLHKTIMATQRADLAGELFLQVRNKVVAAYQEIMRMQV